MAKRHILSGAFCVMPESYFPCKKNCVMKFSHLAILLLASILLFTQCKKEENLPPTDYIMVKFVNQTGKDIEGLVVSRATVGDLGKGKTTREYFQYETLGQQFGYALVEAVGNIGGKKHFTASACRGICGTESAPYGTWLEPGHYKMSIHLSKSEGNAMEFRMEQ